MKEVRFNNGVMMPAVGFGVYQIPKSETTQDGTHRSFANRM